MPKIVRPLTDKEVKAATYALHAEHGHPVAKKLFDGGGLYLEASPNGRKTWNLKYRVAGTERRITLGTYPGMGLAEARKRREEAKELVRDGHDPVQKRQLERVRAETASATTYEGIAREMHELNPLNWQAAHKKKWLAMQVRHIFPRLGRLPITAITAKVLHVPLQAVEHTGKLETATSLRQYAGQVFDYAVRTERATANPATSLRRAMKAPIQRGYAAITDVERLPDLVRAIHGYHGRVLTKEALWLAALLFQRPGNLRGLQWEWIDFGAQQLVIPSAEMKRTLRAKVQGADHIVPLSAQAIECLKRLQSLSGHGKYVFPSERTGERPMSDGTVNSALRRLGYSKEEMTGHGFRAMARTVLAEHHDIPEAVLEELLGHGKTGPLGSAYDRTQWRKQRREAMATWGAYLEGLTNEPKADKAKVVRMSRKAAA
ncbi:integrase arm-type DNA-binding domain-containing protein [Variovorax sp. OV329]|uniref:tyrosine-type recombinase/integrase n=1 Tax=Variovorax sp. OV329 TaxID=1882825 RepID=UPI0008F0C5DB|nr:integrase arm-type DNA-binding domain-containing protein [Variovorax sp. OV329]SFL87471.1 Integrase [Variovorax sp. OV329]